jgi:hypothetical protein
MGAHDTAPRHIVDTADPLRRDATRLAPEHRTRRRALRL